jgi:hypothetical protein
MKTRIIFLFFLIVFLTTLYPSSAMTGDVVGTTTVAWNLQSLQAWGNNKLAVDFGPKGLWNFDGSWVQLSYWNPRHMEAWGVNQLAVDFGANGLWTFDGKTWQRISLKTE